MRPSNDYYRELQNGVGELRTVLTELGASVASLDLFDEFLQNSEFELALHVACQYLLEPGVRRQPNDVLDRIESLHNTMAIDDDCATRLRAK